MVLLHEGLAALEYFGERLSDILRDHEIPVEIVKGRPNGDAKARKLYYVSPLYELLMHYHAD